MICNKGFAKANTVKYIENWWLKNPDSNSKHPIALTMSRPLNHVLLHPFNVLKITLTGQ